MFWFKKKPEPKSPKPSRVAVHCTDGRTIVHYARFRTIHDSGRLSLHDKQGGGYTVADYAPGTWHSVTCGTRKVSKVDKEKQL